MRAYRNFGINFMAVLAALGITLGACMGLDALAQTTPGGSGGGFSSCAPCNPYNVTQANGWGVAQGGNTIYLDPSYTGGRAVVSLNQQSGIERDGGDASLRVVTANGSQVRFVDAFGGGNVLATIHDLGTTGSISTSSGRFQNQTDSSDYWAVGESANVIEGLINGTQEFTITPTAVTIPGANLLMVGTFQVDATDVMTLRTAAGTAVATVKTTRDSTGGTGLEIENEAASTSFDVDVGGTCMNWYDGATLHGGICGGASDRFFLDDGTDARFGTTGQPIAGIYEGSETEGGSLGTFTAHTCTQVADVALNGTVDPQSPCFVGASPYGSGWNKICSINCGVDNVDNTSALVTVCVRSATNTDCDGSNTMTWQVAVFNFD